jgi:hypothetical protein
MGWGTRVGLVGVVMAAAVPASIAAAVVPDSGWVCRQQADAVLDQLATVGHDALEGRGSYPAAGPRCDEPGLRLSVADTRTARVRLVDRGWTPHGPDRFTSPSGAYAVRFEGSSVWLAPT